MISVFRFEGFDSRQGAGLYVEEKTLCKDLELVMRVLNFLSVLQKGCLLTCLSTGYPVPNLSEVSWFLAPNW